MTQEIPLDVRHPPRVDPADETTIIAYDLPPRPSWVLLTEIPPRATVLHNEDARDWKQRIFNYSGVQLRLNYSATPE